MKAQEIINEMQKLPVRQKIYVKEQAIHLIRKQEEESQMKKAANSLYADYLTDRELTLFTNLDCENFYEAR